MAASLDDIVKAIEKGFAKAGKGKGKRAAAGTGKQGKLKTGAGPPGASLEDELRLLTEYDKKLKGLGKTEIGRAARAQQAVLIAEQELKILQEKVKQKDILSEQDALALAEAQKAVDLAEEKVDKLDQAGQKIQEEIDLMRDFGAEVADAILPFEKSKFFNVAAMGKLWDVMTSGAAATAAAVVTIGVGLLENLIGGIIEAIFALDNMESGMMKATGMSREMARGFADASDEVSHLWISTEEYSEAAVGLFGTFTDFTMLNKEMQYELANTAAVLSKWGVGAQEIGKSFQFATKMMGQTALEANKTTLEMASLAMNLQVPVDQMMGDFNNMMPQLAKLGPTAAKSFKEMARVSKITGLEIGKLLSLTDKFDTFEGAAEMTGQLNAALGGNFVNAMDMMMETDPVGRFEQLRGALDSAGLTFDDMSYYQRKFFAESMGLSDVGDLALMMSGNMDALGSETNKTAAEYEEMAQKAAEQATVQEKFQGFLDDIMRTIVDSGMLDDIHELFDQFSRTKGQVGPLAELKNVIVSIGKVITESIKPAFKWIREHWEEIVFWTKAFLLLKAGQAIAGVAGPIWSTVKGLKKMGDRFMGAAKDAGGWMAKLKGGSEAASETGETVKDLAGKLSEAGETGETAAGGLDKVGKGSKGAGKAAGKSAGQLMAMGFAILLVGAGIAVAALGMAQFVKAFHGMEPANILAVSVAILALGVAIAIIAKVFLGSVAGLSIGTGVVIAMGFAFLLMGAGVAIAAVGMGIMVSHLKGMNPAILFATAAGLAALGASMWALSLGLASLANPVTAAGLTAFTAFIYGLATAVAWLALSLALVVIPLIILFDLLTEVKALASAAESMTTVVEAINDVSLAKALAIGTINITKGAGGGGGGSGGGGGGGGAGGGQKITIKLDASQTKLFFEGLAIEAQGKTAAGAAGTR